MKPNLKDLTDDEIDKLLAELLGWRLEIDEGEYPLKWWIDDSKTTEDETGVVMQAKDWKPTSDAQQIQDYVSPKLEELDCDITFSSIVVNYKSKRIRSRNVIIEIFGKELAYRQRINKNQINRTTCEAVIEALWEIGKSDD